MSADIPPVWSFDNCPFHICLCKHQSCVLHYTANIQFLLDNWVFWPSSVTVYDGKSETADESHQGNEQRIHMTVGCKKSLSEMHRNSPSRPKLGSSLLEINAVLIKHFNTNKRKEYCYQYRKKVLLSPASVRVSTFSPRPDGGGGEGSEEPRNLSLDS